MKTAPCILALFGLACAACNGHTRPQEMTPATVSFRASNTLSEEYTARLSYAVDAASVGGGTASGALVPSEVLRPGESREWREAVHTYVGASLTVSWQTWLPGQPARTRAGSSGKVLTAAETLCSLALEAVPNEPANVVVSCAP